MKSCCHKTRLEYYKQRLERFYWNTLLIKRKHTIPVIRYFLEYPVAASKALTDWSSNGYLLIAKPNPLESAFWTAFCISCKVSDAAVSVILGFSCESAILPCVKKLSVFFSRSDVMLFCRCYFHKNELDLILVVTSNFSYNNWFDVFVIQFSRRQL